MSFDRRSYPSTHRLALAAGVALRPTSAVARRISVSVTVSVQGQNALRLRVTR